MKLDSGHPYVSDNVSETFKWNEVKSELWLNLTENLPLLWCSYTGVANIKIQIKTKICG